MRTPCPVVLLHLACFCAVMSTARGAEPSEEPPAEQVRQAMRKGTAFLKDQIRTRQRVHGLGGGAWGPYGERPGALASQAVLALLEAGAKPDDPALAEALDYLRSVRPGLTYALGLQTQALCRADPKKDADLIQHNVDELLRGARREGGRLVGWDRGKGEYFGKTPPVTAGDTWSAVMALHAASQAGVRVEEETWKEIRAYYLRPRTGSARARTGGGSAACWLRPRSCAWTAARTCASTPRPWTC